MVTSRTPSTARKPSSRSVPKAASPTRSSCYGFQLVLSRLQRGTLGELRPIVEAAVVDNPDQSTFRALLAVAYVEAGDTERALQLLQAESADVFASLPYDNAWLISLTMLAWVAIELHATEPAQQLLELLAPYHEQLPAVSIGCSPPVACYLGGLASVLGRYDEAENYFIEATDLNTRGDMKFAAAWTQLLWGRMRAVRSSPGDSERARGLLTSAQTAAAAHGYANIERRATEALERLD